MAIEYRGCRGLVYAKVIMDDNSTETGHGYVTGTVKPLAPVATISKTVETSTATHYYDNIGAIIIDSEGNDTVTLTCAIPSDEVLADILGRTYISSKKKYIESKPVKEYFAIGYILGEIGEGEEEEYVWRYKGTFAEPEITSNTEADNTDANNISLTFTGVYTDHIFANGKGAGVPGVAKAMKTNSGQDIFTEAQYFASVTTPDTPDPTI